jgi:hypothetical protein
MNRNTVAAICCMCSLLAACGGGDDDQGPVGTTPGTAGVTAAVPSSAFQSVDSFIAYVRQLAADDTSEPLALPDVAAPTTDTAEPAA